MVSKAKIVLNFLHFTSILICNPTAMTESGFFSLYIFIFFFKKRRSKIQVGITRIMSKLKSIKQKEPGYIFKPFPIVNLS